MWTISVRHNGDQLATWQSAGLPDVAAIKAYYLDVRGVRVQGVQYRFL